VKPVAHLKDRDENFTGAVMRRNRGCGRGFKSANGSEKPTTVHSSEIDTVMSPSGPMVGSGLDLECDFARRRLTHERQPTDLAWFWLAWARVAHRQQLRVEEPC